MRRGEYFKQGILVGGLFVGAFGSLRQDYLGKEGMREALEKHWMPERYSVPLALAFLAFAVAVMIVCTRRYTREDSDEEE